jgi:ATP-binding cassette subfamily F protein uup
VCDRQVALLGDGTIRDLPGGVEQYLELRRAAMADESGAAKVAGTSGMSSGPTAVDDKPGDAGPTSAADARANRKELQRIERRLQLLARKETDLHERMVVVADDYVALGALEVELRAVHDERSTLEERWLEVADED